MEEIAAENQNPQIAQETKTVPPQLPEKPRSIKILQWFYFVLFILGLFLFVLGVISLIEGTVLLCGGTEETCKALAINYFWRVTPLPIILGFIFVLLWKYKPGLLRLVLLVIANILLISYWFIFVD